MLLLLLSLLLYDNTVSRLFPQTQIEQLCINLLHALFCGMGVCNQLLV